MDESISWKKYSILRENVSVIQNNLLFRQMWGLFCIFLTGQTASLICTENLSRWQGPEVIDLYISASDDFHTSGPEKMTVTIYNLWQPPTVNNLPNAVTVSEGATSPTTLYTVSCNRLNISDYNQCIKYIVSNTMGVYYRPPIDNTHFWSVYQGVLQTSLKSNLNLTKKQ